MTKILLSIIVLNFTILISSTLANISQPDTFCQSISPSSLGVQNVKLSHIRVFRQDGAEFVVPLATPTTNYSSGNIGSLTAVDIPMTKGPDSNSKQVGRFQGLYAGVSSTNRFTNSFMNHIVFTQGKCSGSSISIFGISNTDAIVRERPVIGGTGCYRLASGFVQTTNVTQNDIFVSRTFEDGALEFTYMKK
ncbi:hypothetical protein ACFE04_021915 [Oxalis oulophora]